ncbi:hypothetical protein PLCT2_02498 [Planctomycetaceae bacterium]|nr:hypothetical protein PLCT2_02498 [Planctomycetaceae bacterium]
MSDSSGGGVPVVRLSERSFRALKQAAALSNRSMSDVASLCVRRALPILLREWTEEMILTLDNGSKHVITTLGTRPIEDTRAAESGGKKMNGIQELRAPEMTRWREGNQRLVWLFHCYFTKLNSDRIQEGLDEESLAALGESAWRICKNKGVISFGGDGGSALIESNLRNETTSDRRQLSAMANMIPGDLVVATLGQRVLGWGKAKSGPRSTLVYDYEPVELKKGRNQFVNWFWHCAWVDWQQEFTRKRILTPSSVPLQPTVRWPTPQNEEAWQFLRANAIPVGLHGEVDSPRNSEEE